VIPSAYPAQLILIFGVPSALWTRNWVVPESSPASTA